MALSVKVGTYTGDGGTTQTVTGVGFQPKVVMVFATTGVGDENAACFKTADMSTGATGITANMGENGQQSLGLIDSFTSDGFVVRGTVVGKNVSGVAYYFLALAGTSCVTGTYSGDGNDNRSISGIGFRPKWVVIQGSTNFAEHKNTATGNTTDSSQTFSVVADSSDLIQALEVDGFQVGAKNTGGRSVNASGVTFYYFAVDGTNVASGTYLGDGVDDRGITGAGFDPTAVIVKNNDTQQGRSYSGNTGDSSNFMRGNNAPAANGIQALITDGFQIGTDNTVNANGSTYFWTAFGDGGGAAAETRDGRALSLIGVG